MKTINIEEHLTIFPHLKMYTFKCGKIVKKTYAKFILKLLMSFFVKTIEYYYIFWSFHHFLVNAHVNRLLFSITFGIVFVLFSEVYNLMSNPPYDLHNPYKLSAFIYGFISGLFMHFFSGINIDDIDKIFNKY